ncbi:toll-like receptor 2 [Pocillopora damicornis]|uniref:toll-like receptor 2 n=1 Tax=Pocillopora damicornis TaxID=46731 RepID=UPI000F54DF2A|nr:toll-like receptor 2 [Pocillopora damicornis]
MREKEVKLICNVSDAKNYIWYKDERKIHLPSDRYFVKSHWYLQITDVLKSDSGTFVCLASNSYGKLNCTVRLIVEDPTASPTNVLGDKARDALVPGIVSAGVLITVAALSFICWRRRSRSKEPVNSAISMSELEFEYDAFVIFSSQDSDWVTKTLILTLEEKHGFKCCVHYRDFVVGVPFRENMVNSVYKSRKTIAVVSNNFFNSSYCGSEMDYALHRLMERRDNSLVVIKLDDVDRGKLPKELRERSFIDLSKNVEKEHWERKLVKCLTIPCDLSQEQIL